MTIIPVPNITTTAPQRPLRGGAGGGGRPTITAKRKKLPSLVILLVVFGGLLLWQGSRPLHRSSALYYSDSRSNTAELDLLSVLSSLSSNVGSSTSSVITADPLGIPSGQAVALQNDRNVFDADQDARRHAHNYGGKGDALHLGGFVADIDLNGISPTVWKNLISRWNMKSVLDLGCGRGFATAWFDTHGVRTLGVDGSADAIEHNAVPLERRGQVLVEHDFARGPWWPEQTFDAVWSNEFLEHVGLHQMKHYLPTLRKAAYLFVTTSESEGWHHVELHTDEWWKQKMLAWGFHYNLEMTRQIRQWALDEAEKQIPIPFKPNSHYDAQYIAHSMKVFVNPVVASLPQHDHLLYEPGCFKANLGTLEQRPCGDNPEETIIPDKYLPIKLNAAMDEAWEKLVSNALSETSSAESNTGTKASSVSDVTKRWDGTLPELLQRIRMRNFANMPTIPVIAWPYVSMGINTAEHKHIEENGIQESPYLRLSMDLDDFSEHMVWIGDTGFGAGWNLWCAAFLKVIQEARLKREKQGLPTKWPIFIVDFTDNVNLQRCKVIENYMGREYVKYSTRSLGAKRKWNEDKKWVEFGEKLNTTRSDGLTYQHTPLVVRTDTIESLNHTLASRGMKLTEPIERLNRTKDVIHLWPSNRKGINMQSAQFRTVISHSIEDLAKKHNFNAFVGLAGQALRTGRRQVSDAYIDILLDAKIVILSQRDEWEDHYRLMEALVSGALVMQDFMHGKPAGLTNGTGLIEYSTPQNLESLILYYLKHDEERMEIGRQGREIAMKFHRTWHRVEEVIFGEILSTCESKPPGGNCPYIVHANEH